MASTVAAAGGGQRVPKRRGPISCAECRRLKIKCDRIVPCTPCQKRGCASLCPDGSLVSKGSRYILSDTETLHRKIEELTLRVRELEKGLEDERSQHSSEKHPLLEDHLLSIAAPPTQEDHEAEAEDGPISTFGTLMIADDGTGMKWLGSTAVAAWFLKDEAEGVTEPLHYIDHNHGHHRPVNTILPTNLFEICQNFPFGNVIADDRTKDILYGYIPREEAEAMLFIDRYFNNIGWLYNIVPRKRLQEMVAILYDHSMPILAPHRLAIIYTVFALNTLVDQHPRPEWFSTNTYCELARAALGIETIFGNNATLATVQALSLLSLWYQLADDSGDPSKSWGCLGLTFKVAQSIGLHRDGKNWNLPEEEAMDRRRVFWELQSIDTWQALGYGRPPSLVKPHFDCPQPFDTEDSLGHPPHFHRWKHHYIAEGIMAILEQALISNSSAATSPPYATILKLDSKVRSCAIPAKLQLKDPAARSQADEMLLLQHYTAHLSRESALMYLHRGFFARAVFDPPHDPLRNKFAHSVLAVYTSACQILKWFKELVDNHAYLLSRIFGWWGHAFSSAVTLGGLVTMAPACNLAEQALREYDSAVEFLQRGTVGPQARRILPALEKLQTKAHNSYQLQLAGKWKPEMNKKAPPPAEMPGLGTAVLPLAKKSTSAGTQSPQSTQGSQPSPPRDSPGPQSYGEPLPVPRHQSHHSHSYGVPQPLSHGHLPPHSVYAPQQGVNAAHPDLWRLEMQDAIPDATSIRATVSPQELMHPPVLSRRNTADNSQFSNPHSPLHPSHNPNADPNANPNPPFVTLINAEFSMKGVETSRPYPPAHSFDDFLRLHKLQEQGVRRPTLPSTNFNMPSHSHHPQHSQSFDFGSMERTRDPWGEMHDANHYDATAATTQTTQYPVHNETQRMSENAYYQDSGSTLNGMEGLRHPSNDNIYNDLSWQVFMNGLGI